ncbi:lamin Dm0-like protein [Leptotrombidium deliense]|uniref:Lamin Dm0-like protein n=1 Tax=Leptotrombidium deliense TaxID=299467 RepID=A0A443SG13_9ACAR|nr:lamin Dm0-like protein [Leptotrombidium deliense]
MATRSRKATHKEEVTSSERPSSPLRQTVVSRLQEKQDLQHLNDRLANYIEVVRNLQIENNRLVTQVSTTREIHVKEVEKVKEVYERENSDLRSLLDDVSRQKTKCEMDLANALRNLSDMRNKMDKKEKEDSSRVKMIAQLEKELNDAEQRCNKAISNQRKAEEAAKEAIGDKDEILDQLKVAQQQLESELMLRVSLENKVTGLNEELRTKQSLHDQELSSVREMSQKYVEEHIEEEIRGEYEQKRVDELRQLREENEMQLRMNREDMENKYENVLNDLQKRFENKTNSESKFRNEANNLKSKVEALNAKVSEYENSNTFLNSRLKDLESMIEQERKWHDSAIKEKDAEIQRLMEELQSTAKEYQELLDIKVALDMEINAYRKLLEGEETRLSMSQPATPSADISARYLSPRGQRGVKRKKLYSNEDTYYDTDSKATGDVVIDNFDEEGKFIKLFNKGDKDISLGNWQLTKSANDESVTFKFHRSVVIKAQSYVTVWSSDSGVVHSPPTDILMKDKRWCVGDVVHSKLVSSNGDVCIIFICA